MASYFEKILMQSAILFFINFFPKFFEKAESLNPFNDLVFFLSKSCKIFKTKLLKIKQRTNLNPQF